MRESPRAVSRRSMRSRNVIWEYSHIHQRASSGFFPLTSVWEAPQHACMMDLPAFLDRAEAFARAAGIRPSYVSLKILNDGKGIKSLRAGATITLRRLETAQARLDALERAFAAKRDGVGLANHEAAA